MPATVGISETSRSLLTQLAQEEGTSMTQVLDAALKTYRRQQFFTKAASAYEALASEPPASADYRQELAGLDALAADGIEAAAS